MTGMARDAAHAVLHRTDLLLALHVLLQWSLRRCFCAPQSFPLLSSTLEGIEDLWLDGGLRNMHQIFLVALLCG